MARKTVGYVQMEWTCPNCDSRNPGSAKICRSCGYAQPDDVEFEQAAQEDIITNEAEITRAKAGADVHCRYCGTRNPANAKTCTQCGASLEEATARSSGRVVGAYKTAPAADIICPSCGAENKATASKCTQCGVALSRSPARPPDRAEDTTTKTVPGSTNKMRFIMGLIAVVVLVCIFAFVFLFGSTEDVTGNVSGSLWTRTISIEKLSPVKRDTWRDEIPSEAVVGVCTAKLRYTQDSPSSGAKEVCGTPYTVDTGSGYGEVVQDCQYEIYEDYCSYTVKEWQQIDEATLNGTDFNPRWPDSNLSSGEREGNRAETYTVIFDVDGKQYEYNTNSSEFSRYKIGSRWSLKVNGFGSVVDSTPLN